MPRHDGRRPAQLRPVQIIRHYTRFAPGSVLIKMGHTHVLCTASFVEGTAPFREGTGLGWLTAEYDMLPGSTPDRKTRSRTKLDGRTQEIQRLIGRSLRAVSNLAELGENSIYIDCDVLQADGGTRTAAITGAYVALCDAVRTLRKEGKIPGPVIADAVAAISVGIVKGQVLLDLNYVEDSGAQADCNIVMTGKGHFVEVQSTAEKTPFSEQDLQKMIALARRGIRQLIAAQRKAMA